LTLAGRLPPLEKFVQGLYRSSILKWFQHGVEQAMPGYQEILIIAAVILGIFFIPRMLEQKKPPPRVIPPRKNLSGRWRLAIALSIVHPLIAAAIMQPWRSDAFLFGYIGLGPVLLGWLLYWVSRGFVRK
jgi:hypothetical protein